MPTWNILWWKRCSWCDVTSLLYIDCSTLSSFIAPDQSVSKQNFFVFVCFCFSFFAFRQLLPFPNPTCANRHECKVCTSVECVGGVGGARPSWRATCDLIRGSDPFIAHSVRTPSNRQAICTATCDNSTPSSPPTCPPTSLTYGFRRL